MRAQIAGKLMRVNDMTNRGQVKRTLEDIAHSIRSEGVIDHYKSGTTQEYWYAFGQYWLFSNSKRGTLKSIEQVDKNGNRISL